VCKQCGVCRATGANALAQEQSICICAVAAAAQLRQQRGGQLLQSCATPQYILSHTAHAAAHHISPFPLHARRMWRQQCRHIITRPTTPPPLRPGAGSALRPLGGRRQHHNRPSQQSSSSSSSSSPISQPQTAVRRRGARCCCCCCCSSTAVK
jgi:hypothetical protein